MSAPKPTNLEPTTAKAANTPMMLAVARGDLEQVQALTSKGESLNTLTEEGTPLARAAVRGHDRIAWYLLSEGANPDLADEHGYTPLMIAARQGNRRMIQLLLSAGAKVNAISAHGDTPVMLAARAGNLSAVKALLEAGANVNVSKDGKSLLMHVVEGGDLLTAEVLLAAGADVNYADGSGTTALDLARQNHNQDLQMLLVQAGAE